MLNVELPSFVEETLRRLVGGGFEAYIVGGCLRDSLLGLAPKDYDVATSALPSEIAACFSSEKVIETGIRHGTVTVLIGGGAVEVTTFRVDGDYSDHRHPEQVRFTDSLEADLSRRDFTINAFAYAPERGIIDLFGGENDLSAKLIRAVGEPSERFTEDALRILRALRFSSTLGFAIEEKTAAAIFAHASELKNISVERVAGELVGIIMGQGCRRVLTKYATVLAAVIPEITPSIGFNQQNKYHKYTVWEHIAVTVASCPRERIVRLAMLFHDMGKPECFKEDDNGGGHFRGHQKVSADMAGEILRRLHFDNITRAQVTTLIENHDRPFLQDKVAIKRLLHELGEEIFFKLLDVQRADACAKEEFCKERLPFYACVEAQAREIIARGECYRISGLALSGRDCLTVGLSGAAIGMALDKLLEDVIDGKLPNERGALLDRLSKL